MNLSRFTMTVTALLGISVVVLWLILCARKDGLSATYCTSQVRFLACDRPTVDLGRILRPVSTPMRLAFMLRNVSQVSVRLRVASTSCTCAKAVLATKHLDPNEEARLDAEWNIADRPGTQSVAVLVQTDNSPREQIELRGQVEVIDRLVINPPEITLQNIRPNEIRTTAIRISAGPGKELSPSLSLKIIGAGANTIIPHLTERSESTAIWTISVTGRPGLGRATSFLVVTTGDLEQPEIRIPLLMTHLEMFEAIPHVVLFGREAGEDEAQLVTVRSGVSGPVEIERIAYDSDCIHVEQQAIAGASEAGLSIKPVDPNPGHTCKGGTIQVFVKGANAPVTIHYVFLHGHKP